LKIERGRALSDPRAVIGNGEKSSQFVGGGGGGTKEW